MRPDENHFVRMAGRQRPTRTLVVSQRDHWIYARASARGRVAGSRIAMPNKNRELSKNAAGLKLSCDRLDACSGVN